MEQQEEGRSSNSRAPATAASSGTRPEDSAQPVQLHSRRCPTHTPQPPRNAPATKKRGWGQGGQQPTAFWGLGELMASITVPLNSSFVLLVGQCRQPLRSLWGQGSHAGQQSAEAAAAQAPSRFLSWGQLSEQEKRKKDDPPQKK